MPSLQRRYCMDLRRPGLGTRGAEEPGARPTPIKGRA
jgi:hypothetical protein